MAPRILAVGDIHGCTAALVAAMEAAAPRADDTVVALGDYVDRGPDSRGTIDYLIAMAARGIDHCATKGRHRRVPHTIANVQPRPGAPDLPVELVAFVCQSVRLGGQGCKYGNCRQQTKRQ